MAIIRIHTGPDGKSHFEDVVPRFEPRGDKSASAELIPGSGLVIRRFDADRSNPWHHAPGRAAVFTLGGAVDIEIGDGTVRRLGPGDSLIARSETDAPSDAKRSPCALAQTGRRVGGGCGRGVDRTRSRERRRTSCA